jgi:hypothetical protein
VAIPLADARYADHLAALTLSTLRAYVSALGGKLRIVADFGDREYRLT